MLKSLLPYYRGQVKCIYINPSYNTRGTFEHYDDNLQHAEWLAMIWPRLVLLCELLGEDASVWVSIDDNEGHCVKIIMDEVFGQDNFLAEVIWQKRTSRENRAPIGFSHDTILAYGKAPAAEWKAVRNALLPSLMGFPIPIIMGVSHGVRSPFQRKGSGPTRCTGYKRRTALFSNLRAGAAGALWKRSSGATKPKVAFTFLGTAQGDHELSSLLAKRRDWCP